MQTSPNISKQVIFLLSLIFCFQILTWAQANPTPSQDLPTNVVAVVVPAKMAPLSDNSYRIGIGDLIDIRVLNHPEISKETRVEGRGTIRIPYVGELLASCLTESQLSGIIAEKFRKYIKEPQVDVFIKEYSSQPVAVIGAVDKPGRFQLQRRVRLIELLTYAGGPKLEKAGHTLHLIRSGEKDACATDSTGQSNTTMEAPVPQLLSFKLRDLLTGGADANLYVQPGDIISLPEAEQVFVTGYVMKPGALQLNTKITLMQAIGMAGGYAPEAQKKKIKLSRPAADSNNRIEQIINVEDIEKHKIQDIVLQANDLIEVPNSAGKTILNGLLRTALPSAAGSLGTLPLYILR